MDITLSRYCFHERNENLCSRRHRSVATVTGDFERTAVCLPGRCSTRRTTDSCCINVAGSIRNSRDMGKPDQAAIDRVRDEVWPEEKC
jgi:hypothetical protein